MQTENGLIVGCYTLDLYCVVDNTFGQFTGRTESECIRAARRSGWRVSSTRVLCPQHATKQSFTADRLGAPPQTEAKGK